MNSKAGVGCLRGGVGKLLLHAARVLSSALSALLCKGRQNMVWTPCSAIAALATLTKLKPRALSRGWFALGS